MNLSKSELAELDLAVTRALGKRSYLVGQKEAMDRGLPLPSKNTKQCYVLENSTPVLFGPSTDWGQGGPIIHEQGITISYINMKLDDKIWYATLGMEEPEGTGPTPLIAAMRAFVASNEEK